jgi:hypothetical protein
VLLTGLAGALFALGHHHKVLGRLDLQVLALLIADDVGRPAALAADALFGRASDDPFDPGQMGRQLLPARVRARRRLGRPRRDEGFTLALGGHFGSTDPRLDFQERQLRVRELLTAGPVLVNADQAQPLF